MLSRLFSPFRKIIFKNLRVRAFIVTRLKNSQVAETVVFKSGQFSFDITQRHSIICLDPFCVAIWIHPEQLSSFDPKSATVLFQKEARTRARLQLSLIERTQQDNSVLLLYEATQAACCQLNSLARFLTLFFFLKNKTSSYRERKFIAALYSYPRKIIVVSYKEDGYCNIFPMDIQGYIAESNLYVLGLRTTNITLDKILATKKLVISDTDKADIETIYSLGKHLSVSPPPIDALTFATTNSELFQFPVPDFSSSYKEVEIIRNRKMGYHVLLVGRVVNVKQTTDDPASLYHLHILEFLNAGYENISDVIY